MARTSSSSERRARNDHREMAGEIPTNTHSRRSTIPHTVRYVHRAAGLRRLAQHIAHASIDNLRRLSGRTSYSTRLGSTSRMVSRQGQRESVSRFIGIATRGILRTSTRWMHRRTTRIRSTCSRRRHGDRRIIPMVLEKRISTTVLVSADFRHDPRQAHRSLRRLMAQDVVRTVLHGWS